MRLFPKTSGFTLVELMITIAILAIIMFWAVPNYTRQINEVRRSDAQAILLGEVQRLERCFSDRDTYLGCEPNDYKVQFSSPKGYYRVTGLVTASNYTLNATADPAGDQADDERCITFSINNLGQKTAFATPIDIDGDGSVDPAENTTTECWK